MVSSPAKYLKTSGELTRRRMNVKWVNSKQRLWQLEEYDSYFTTLPKGAHKHLDFTHFSHNAVHSQTEFWKRGVNKRGELLILKPTFPRSPCLPSIEKKMPGETGECIHLKHFTLLQSKRNESCSLMKHNRVEKSA